MFDAKPRLWSSAGFLLALLPASAAAGDGLVKGGYVYLSPGVLAVPVGQFEDYVDVSYQWSLGGGYMWRPGPLMIAVGGAFEHMPWNFENDFACDDPDFCLRGNTLRIVPELRIGGGNNTVVGYGVIRPGLGIAMWHFRCDLPGAANFCDQSDSEAGFNLGIGGGVLGSIVSGFAIGGEVGADLLFLDHHDAPFDAENEAHSISIKVILAWFFG